MDPKKTGAYLAALRKARGLTQQEIAERLDISNKTVSKWESGGGFPDITVLPALAELYGVTADDILAGESLAGRRSGEGAADTAAGRRRLLSRLRIRFDICFALSLALCAVAVLRVPYAGLVSLPASAALTWIGYILVTHPVRYGGVEADAGLWIDLYRKLLTATILQWYALLCLVRLGELDLSGSGLGTLYGLRYTGDRWKPVLFCAGAVLLWALLQRALTRLAGSSAKLLPGRWQVWLAWGLWAVLFLALWQAADGSYQSAAAPWIQRYGENFMHDVRFDEMWPILRQRRDTEVGPWYTARLAVLAAGGLSGLALASSQLLLWKKRRRPLAEGEKG